MRKILGLFLLFTPLLLNGCLSWNRYYLDRGHNSFNRGKYDYAMEYYNLALKYDEQRAEAYLGRGAIWLKKKDYDRAIINFTEALAINSSYASAYFNRALALEEKGNFDSAIADCSKGLDIDQSNDMPYLLRGDIWTEKGNYERAIDDYTNALRINPISDRAYSSRANSWYMKGDYKKAIFDLIKALDINPRNDEVYNNYAWLLATCPDGRYRNGAKALEMAKKAVKINPTEINMDTLATAYAESGKFEDAIITQEKVIFLQNKKNKIETLIESKERLKFYKAGKPWRDTQKGGMGQ